MLRRKTRLLAPLAALALLGALAACGDDSGDKAKASDSASPSESTSASTSADLTDGTIDGITVTGDVGAAPKVSWADGGVSQSEPVRQVVTQGDGDTIAKGDKVFVQIWVGNGTTKKQAYTSFTGKPSVISVNTSQTLPILANALEGQKVGSRLLVAQSASGAFGDPTGSPDLKLGAKDTAVFLVDVVGALLDGPQGADKTPAKWAPAIDASGDLPISLDFSGAPEPTGKFLRTTLVAGEGATLKAGDHVFVNYLGQVYNGKKPFDDSYSKGQPFDFDLGGGSVIKGWDQGLVGVKVGSRVILQIPPDWGYGKDGAPSVGIGPTDTLYFVVDILGAT
ncbi:MAG: FKBP-type peptidyl-prolyl cis-trans isomerase [Nocardioidaceae bacterium]